jgi:hypothetical protein
MTLVIGEMPFWPVQAITCAVIAIALFLLGRYLNQGRRKRGTSGGLDAFTFIWGLLILGLVRLFPQPGGFEGFLDRMERL